MAPGAMIEGSKVDVEGSKVEIEGEKCGLDMSSYEDLPPTSVGGDCNGGDGKDDYVFVNGSDAGSDDHGENASELDGHRSCNEVNGDGQSEVQSRGVDVDVVLENDPDVKGENGVGELNFSGSSVGDSEEKLDGERNVSDHSEVDNGHGDKVEESVELVKENGEIKPETKIVDEDVGVNHTNDVVLDGVDNRECSVEKKDNSNSGVDDSTTSVLPDDDDKVKVSVGADEGSVAEFPVKDEVHDETKIEPLDKDVKTLRDEDQGNQGNEVADGEIEPLDKDVKGVQPSESGDVEGQTREDGVLEGGEVGSDSVDIGSTEPLVGDVIDENHSSYNQQQESQSVYGVDEVVPNEAEVKEEEDLDNSTVDVKQNLESVDSDAVKREAENEVIYLTSESDGIQEIQTDPLQPEEAESQTLELVPKEAENEVIEGGDVDSSDSVVNQETTTSLDSEAVACDLKPSEEDDMKIESAPELIVEETEIEEPQSESLESEEVANESGVESTERSVEEPVSDVTAHVDDGVGVEANEGDLEQKSDVIAEVVGAESTARSVEEPVSDVTTHVDEANEGDLKEKSDLIAEVVAIESTARSVEEPVSVTTHIDDDVGVEANEGDLKEKSDVIAEVVGIESTARSVEEPVSDVTTHVDEANEGDLKEKSDLIAEVAGIQESTVVEDVIPDQATEETGSINVSDKEISLEDRDSEKAVVVEESTNVSEIQAANDTAVDEEDRSDLGKECLSEKVSDDLVNDTQTAPVSGETTNDAEDSVKSEEGHDAVSEVDPVKEEVVDNAASAADAKAESGNDSIPDHAHDSSLETTATNGEIDVANKSNSSSSDSLKSKISFGSFVCEAPVSIRPEVSDRSVELSPESKIKPSNGVAVQNGEANGVHSIGLSHDKVGLEVSSVEHVNSDEAVAIKGQQNTDVVRRPFYYLIRVPRCEDEKLREQIRLGELQVEEKTRSRDAVRMEYHKRKGAIVQVKADLEAAKSEERAARELVKAKRREIDESQSVVNLAKNAITVEDVQAQILNMEHRIQHETLHLKEEKQLVRDIKQMKNFKDQLHGNAQKQEELKQALDQKDQVEEQLKVLRKELAALRDELSKAEENVKVVQKRYDEESALLNESYIKFKSADTVRQDAYAHLLDLRKQWSEKNKHFRGYKDDARAANDLAVAGDMSNLERHCVDQVEKFMDLWNNDDKFRMEYTKYNARSTLRRLRTLDGRSLGPDEEPPSFGNASNDRVTVSAKVNSVPAVTSVEGDFPAMPKLSDANPPKKAVEQKNKTVVPTKKMAEATTTPPKNNSPTEESSGTVETDEEEKKEEQHKLTKEEEEMARKAEEKRREEEEARLREQRKLEEKAKAMEALERKKRMAEKALARAQFRAQKEAEQKEKEREKRAKKKDKKRGITSDPVETEPAVPPESPSQTTTPREPEVTEKPATPKKPQKQKPSLYAKQLKTTKSIPPPLRNRGKRRMQQWMWALATVVVIVALFFLGNSNFLRDNSLLGSEPAY